MAAIDIRGDQPATVDRIVFADSNNWCYTLVALRKSLTDAQIILIDDDDGNTAQLYKSDAENLIKALQKAIELGWTK